MAKRPVKVTISYCSECGYEPQTLALAESLMREFRHELAEIEIIPWYEGAFDVTVDGELVHSMEREGGFAEHETVIAAVRRHQVAL
jgi:selenoprotein W-related protein